MKVEFPNIPLWGSYLVARWAFALMFGESVLTHLTHYDEMLLELTQTKLPYIDLIFPISLIIELVRIISLLTGKYVKLGSIFLFFFTISASLLFFPFWELQGVDAVTSRQNFLKNMALLGALMLIYSCNSGVYQKTIEASSYED